MGNPAVGIAPSKTVFNSPIQAPMPTGYNTSFFSGGGPRSSAQTTATATPPIANPQAPTASQGTAELQATIQRLQATLASLQAQLGALIQKQNPTSDSSTQGGGPSMGSHCCCKSKSMPPVSGYTYDIENTQAPRTIPSSYTPTPQNRIPESQAPAPQAPAPQAPAPLPQTQTPPPVAAPAPAPEARVLPNGNAFPVKDGKIIQKPHSGTHTLGNWQSDNALDIAAPEGTPIYAPADGTVALAKGNNNDPSSRFNGFNFELNGSDNSWFLTHMSKMVVKDGDQVKKGQIVGYVGSANNVSHLHIGQKNGNPEETFKG